MDINYFSKIRILDGGMGQHLLTKGLKTKGSLWSATALVDQKYHHLVTDSHLDFIKSGADVIITNNFSARKMRMVENEAEKYFDYANKKAGELAFKAREISKKNIMIGGSLPPQNDTYVLDSREKNVIKKNFYEQALLLKPFVDFFYLDVLSSSKECEIAINISEKLDLPVLVGLHVKKNGKLPSKESISEVFEKCKSKNWLGLILSCVSPEIIENTVDEIKELKIPFGFKVNLWKNEEPIPASEILAKLNNDDTDNVLNPNQILGTRDDFTDLKFFEFTKKMIDKGATILGGCCETKPSHIKKISAFKK